MQAQGISQFRRYVLQRLVVKIQTMLKNLGGVWAINLISRIDSHANQCISDQFTNLLC